jgi:hypothetical protein
MGISIMAKMPENAALLYDVYEALAQLGWQGNKDEIVARVKRLNLGLPCEDEFSVVCVWLGRCELVHKLDQKQAPGISCQKFQVPDLMAVFRVKTQVIPVLIEVKLCKKNTL